MSGRIAGSTDLPSGEWMAWRRSAQTVTRTWNEWMAAERVDRAERYVRYRRALAEEERTAAELERAVMTERPAHEQSDWCSREIGTARTVMRKSEPNPA